MLGRHIDGAESEELAPRGGEDHLVQREGPRGQPPHRSLGAEAEQEPDLMREVLVTGEGAWREAELARRFAQEAHGTSRPEAPSGLPGGALGGAASLEGLVGIPQRKAGGVDAQDDGAPHLPGGDVRLCDHRRPRGALDASDAEILASDTHPPLEEGEGPLFHHGDLALRHQREQECEDEERDAPDHPANVAEGQATDRGAGALR